MPEPPLPPWRLEGTTLFVRHGVTLPDVCLFTGEPTTPEQRLRLPLSWTPLWFRIAAVLFPMLVIVAYSALRKTSSVEVGLGPAGRKRRRLGLLLTVGAVIDAMVFAYVALERSSVDGGVWMGALFLCFLALFVAALLARIFRVVKIDRRYAHLVIRPQVAEAFARLPPPPAPPG
jgi:uncharacterized membrane protein YhdT